jgi:hypothetical protein
MSDGGTAQYFAGDPEEFTPEVAAVVTRLRALFRDPALARIGAEFTTARPEGQHGADLVIQNPSVPGLALGISIGGGGAGLYWAHVATLEWKDDLDAVREIEQVSVRLDDDGPEAVAEAVREQLDAELQVVETWQSGKLLATEIRAPYPRHPRQERRIWRHRERRLSLPFVAREQRSRPASFLSLI